MKIVNRALFLLLVLAVPLTCILTAANISFRLPDLYRYELNRTGVLKDIGLSEVSSGDLSDFFSKYMIGTLDDFQYPAYYMGRDRPVFNMGEGVVMARLRSMLNVSFLLLLGTFALTLFTHWFLIRQDRKEAVRLAYQAGVALYVLLGAAAAAVALFFGNWHEKIYDWIFPYRFGEDDVLPQLLPFTFFAENVAVIFGISALLLMAGYSITKRLTRPNRMFY